MSLRVSVLRGYVYLAAAIALSFQLGCGGGAKGPLPKNAVPTSPVKGIVKIDGTPTPGVLVCAYPADKLGSLSNLSIDSLSALPNQAGQTTTQADGSFGFSTYMANDGLPEGEYALAFFWTAGGSMEAEGSTVKPEAKPFNKKYAAPTKSEIKVTVTKGKASDMGVLELTTK